MPALIVSRFLSVMAPFSASSAYTSGGRRSLRGAPRLSSNPRSRAMPTRVEVKLLVTDQTVCREVAL
jgi:hypothetical protein